MPGIVFQDCPMPAVVDHVARKFPQLQELFVIFEDAVPFDQ